MSYSFSYAPTNRASCKGACKQKIEKDAIRMGTASDGAGDYQMVSYRNLGCVTKKQWDNMEAKIGDVANADGFAALEPDDQTKVKQAAAAAKAAGPPPKPPKKPKAAAAGAGPSNAPPAPTPTPAPAPAPAAPSAPAALSAPAAPFSPTTMKEQHGFSDMAKCRNFAAVKAQIEANIGFVNVQPAGRWSALHQFSQAGDADAVTYLLSKGADKTLLTSDGKTALDVAKGASVKALLTGAAAAGVSASASIPLAEQHAFCDAAKDNDWDLVKELIEATPGIVNCQPSGRWSALHQAAAAGQPVIVKHLLAKGADKKCVNRDGETPLQVAHPKCVVALGGKLDPGSDDDDEDEDEDEEASDDDDYDDDDGDDDDDYVAEPKKKKAKVAMPGDDD